MVVFVVLGLMTVAALALLVTPLLRRHGEATPREAYDLRIYRDQLRELERDAERGLIGAAQQASARAEIERRMLGAAAAPEKPSRTDPSAVAAIAVALAIPLVAGSLYLWLGKPGLESQPFAARETLAPGPVEQAGSGDIAALVERLAERLETQPDDLEGWLMLGRSYGVLERYDDAVVALRHAVVAADGEPDVTAMLGEYQVFAAGGVVSPDAIETFESALARNRSQPAARFYLGLAKAQAGDAGAAIEGWIALAGEAPADAPWLPSLRQRIAEAAASLGVEIPDVAAAAQAPAARAPGPTREDVETAGAMSAEDRAEMIRGMVAGLAERLEAQPDDLAGWVRLARSYRVLGEAADARDAFARAAALDPDDPALLQDYGGAIVEATADGAPLSQQAVAVFRRLAELDGDNRAALWHVGLAEAQSGNAAEARALWRRLLALLPPDSPDRAAVNQAIARLGEAAPDR